MTFTKPSNVTITQMAQWIDANASSTCDEQTLCEYIYHIVVLKTHQCSFFKDAEQVDDFAIYCTSRLLSRLRNNTPVKSVCNYLNTVLSLWRADYLREFCVGYPDCEMADFDITDYGDYLIDASSEQDFYNYWFDCSHITDVIRKYLKQIPMKKCSSEWINIYTSCLLTLQDRLNYAAQHRKETDVCTSRFIRQLKTKPPILFHFDETKANYITVLVNEIIHALSVEITKTIHSKVTVSGCMKNLVMAANNDEDS